MSTPADKVKKALKQLLRKPENKYCADCPIRSPTWASINLGVFVCLQCSGIHRNLGVHISKVRSVELDTWQKEWVMEMKKIGNKKGNEYWEANMPKGYEGKPTQAEAESLSYKMKKFITDKYEKKMWIPSAKSSSSGKKKSKSKKAADSSSDSSSSSSSSSSDSDSSSSSDEEIKRRRRKELAKKKRQAAKKNASKPTAKKADEHPEPDLDLFGDFQEAPTSVNVATAKVDQVSNDFGMLQVSGSEQDVPFAVPVAAPAAQHAPKSSIDLGSLYQQGSGSGSTYGRGVNYGRQNMMMGQNNFMPQQQQQQNNFMMQQQGQQQHNNNFMMQQQQPNSMMMQQPGQQHNNMMMQQQQPGNNMMMQQQQPGQQQNNMMMPQQQNFMMQQATPQQQQQQNFMMQQGNVQQPSGNNQQQQSGTGSLDPFASIMG
mmetsp:Transcript_614/g.1045  ORF Transcript_614/g.1045 Transcript_614/m.1045 type:complete len:429 (+) Transcript_614:151-1437(+)|eukprot:CAMPEP_0203757302 /NCGR_PEP_ID=MMETSP0098-20131031/10418_1 /ASSEMBLY_ACC=CAM_ASM_000208 /TAXON_ID=96639 /ORGANISM=" , Strain NY0313808BC1" /LENGTH=428 /DNA_ID=CAMNT_0050649505 /DNA_START=28 /DNA_END=1314 /DNA_ORIENTATION=-